MNGQVKTAFPCRHVPEDPGAAKLLGLYRQRQDGLWMQRVMIPGGVLTPEQWRTLGRISREFTPAAPLHLTTRQDIELHDLTAEHVPSAQQMMSKVGLTGLGAGGDSLRNVTVCPCSGIISGAIDLHPLAGEIRRTLEAEEGIFNLPRKFKISLSCCHACGQPWINDLGFVVRRRKSEDGFRLIGAGSMGARPAAGIILFDWLAADDVLPAALAAVRLFAAHGDREHRMRARLRHVREHMGNEAFLAVLQETFKAVKAERAWPEVDLPKAVDGFASRLTLTFVNGDVAPPAADALAELSARDDIRVHISNHHRAIVFGQDGRYLQEAVAALEPLAEAVKPQATVVACPGTRWCKWALVDTNQMANRIRTDLAGKIPPNMTICISGCPNGCAHSAVADIGLTGALSTCGNRKREVFNLSAGGDMGHSDKLTRPVAQKICPDKVVEEITKLVAAAT